MWKTNPATAMAVLPDTFSFWRNGLLLLLLSISMLQMNAQRNITLYNLNAVPQSLSLNPGRMPLSNVYVGIPALGNMNATYSNSSFKFGELMLDGDENFFDNNFEDFLGILDQENRLITDVNINWLEFGFRIKNNFFSFQTGDYATFQVDYPKALFELLNDVSNEQIANTKTYLLDQLGFNGTHFRSYGIGYTRVITPQLSMGVRAKWLSGLANVSTFNQGLSLVNALDNEYLTILGALSVYSSGLQTLENDPSTYFRGTGNRGIAIDFGANLQVSDKIEVFGSILNLGRIRWKNDLTENTILAGNVEFSTSDFDQFEEELNNFVDSLQMPTALPLGSYTTRLPAMAYFGGNYYFRPNTSAGLLINPRFYNGKTDWALSVALQHRLSRFLQAVVNYSTYNRSAFNFGAGIALNAGPLQLYFASDNILPVFNLDNAKNAQFNTGLNLTFGRMTREEQLEAWKTEVPALALKSKIEPLEQEAITDIEAEPTSQQELNNQSEQKSKEELPAKKPKVKSRPEATPAPVVEEVKPYLSFAGIARSDNNDNALTGVSIELYRVQSDGSEELALINSFLDGNIKATLQRSQSYRMVVKKPGFADQEIRITPTEMAGKNELKKNVVLTVVTLTPEPTKPQPKPSAPDVNIQNEAATVQPKPVAEIYKILEISELRTEPHPDGRSLFRLQKGNRVQLLEKTNATWWKVQYVSRIGYVRAAVLEKVE